MKKFSNFWRGSKKPKKQRKYRYNAPLHIKQKFVGVHLSKELREKYRKRSVMVKKGDKVRIVRGQFRKKEGKIERVDMKNGRVIIAGMELTKKDGTKTPTPIHPSNLTIIELDMDDKRRQKRLERK